VIGVMFVVAAALGACLRVLIGDQLNRDFPYGTFLVNVTASFTLGALSQLGSPWPTVAGVAALGAFSTWSSVANEVAALARDRQGTLAWLYLAVTISTGILAAWIGLQVAGYPV
jgi:CrcB protein